MNKLLKPLPTFASEEEEQAFWATHSSADYVDWSKAKRVELPKLRLSTETISLRLPGPLLQQIRLEAKKMDVPYQSFMKMKLAEIFRAGSNHP